VYEIDRPLLVAGKRLIIQGAGSRFAGSTETTAFTHLIGPPPDPVLDERGNLALRADAVEGLWNFVGAGGLIRDMNLSGFNAGVVSKPNDRGDSLPIEVRDIAILHTGRGILSLSASDLTVSGCEISNTIWNGISVAPKFINLELLPNLDVKAVTIIDPEAAGVYFANTIAFLDGVIVQGADGGGVVGVASSSFILDSILNGNKEAGILLAGGYSTIENNIIQSTIALPGDILGDAIILWSWNGVQMQANVSDNLIQTADRAGVSSFGAWVDLADNDIFCVAFDLFGTDYDVFKFQFNDLNGNVCGCGVTGPCKAEGTGLKIPAPVGGLE
jgi:hypothetical protein